MFTIKFFILYAMIDGMISQLSYGSWNTNTYYRAREQLCFSEIDTLGTEILSPVINL